jgi:tRNA(adenine34) deaminase
MTPDPHLRHTQRVTSLMSSKASDLLTSAPHSPMQIALAEAAAAGQRGEVPVGAVIVAADGRIVAQAGNRTRELSDPTAHAEILVIRAACQQLGSERLTVPGVKGASAGFDLYVTLEPCPMCAAAISFARVRRLYYGASDPKSGGVEYGPRIFAQATCHHAPDVYAGLNETAAQSLLRDFFAARR